MNPASARNGYVLGPRIACQSSLKAHETRASVTTVHAARSCLTRYTYEPAVTQARTMSPL